VTNPPASIAESPLPPDSAVLRREFVDLLIRNQTATLRAGMEAAMARMGLGRFVRDIVAPMTTDVGDAWMQGRLELFQEHYYTELVQRLLRTALSARPAGGAQRPHVLLTTASGEPHALGLLMAEVVLTLEGCRCTSLGVQTPVWDIARAAAALEVDVVALSHSGSVSPNETLDALGELRTKLPARVAIWAGGSAPVLRRRKIEGVTPLATLESAAAAVSAWRVVQPPAS
jgi:MerR family transcriptional regulator, light-induced transcriptional regulator